MTIPFDESQEILKYIWERAFDSILAGEDLSLTSIRVNSFSENLDLKEAESLYKEYDLAYALFERFGFEDEVEKAQDIKQDISAHISKLLKESKLECRRCKYCGTKLAWNYPYGMCSDCHDKRFGRKFYYDADDDDFDDDFYQ